MINIFVWPEIAMRETTVDFKNSVVISITSPGSEHVSIKGMNVHKFYFNDVREPLELMDGSTMLPMSEKIADEIAQIVIDNRDKRVWMINCEEGISRSPGVAIGIASVLKTYPDVNKLKSQFPCFNTYVAKLVEEAIRRKMSGMFVNMCK